MNQGGGDAHNDLLFSGRFRRLLLLAARGERQCKGDSDPAHIGSPRRFP
jgi:hypothetical protein